MFVIQYCLFECNHKENWTGYKQKCMICGKQHIFRIIRPSEREKDNPWSYGEVCSQKCFDVWILSR